MENLKKRILLDGEIRTGGIIKVDSFLNHQLDINLLDEMGCEFFNYFKNREVTKILTVESSGIGIACLTARYFSIPVVFAKKSQAKNLSAETYCADVFSYTKGEMFTIRVDNRYISPGDRILIIDDFLANGEALLGLIKIVEKAGARIAGAGICIEKAFQRGGNLIRGMGIDLHSLAVLGVDGESIVFIDK